MFQIDRDDLDELPGRMWPWVEWAAEGVMTGLLSHAAEVMSERDAPAGEALEWASAALDVARGMREAMLAAARRPEGRHLLRRLKSGTTKLAPKDLVVIAALLRERVALDPDKPNDRPLMGVLLAIG